MKKPLKLKKIEGDRETIAKTLDAAAKAQIDELQKSLGDGPRFSSRKLKLKQSNLSGDFERGFFCAVAVYIKESCQENVYDTMAQSLFRQGGDWKNADPQDIEVFRSHGLIQHNDERTRGANKA